MLNTSISPAKHNSEVSQTRTLRSRKPVTVTTGKDSSMTMQDENSMHMFIRPNNLDISEPVSTTPIFNKTYSIRTEAIKTPLNENKYEIINTNGKYHLTCFNLIFSFMGFFLIAV